MTTDTPMEPDQILDRIGTDTPPTVEELTAAQSELSAARDDLAARIKSEASSASFAELTELKGDYDAVTDALSKISEALGAAQAEIDALLADVEGGEDAPAVDEAATEVVEETAPVAASIRATLARVRTQPRPEAPNRDLSETETRLTLRGHRVDGLTPAELGQAFSEAASTFGGSKTSVLSIKTDLHEDRRFGKDASANERKMLDLFGADPMVPVTASGGCCSIPEPIYDQPMLGDLSRPIRESMDVMQASRGAVVAYPPICIPDEGADVWTCTQDAAVDPEDPDTWKTCVAIECDDSEPTLVEPIYKCLTIGTFQERFAPEQWEAIRFQTSKLAMRKAEARLFGWLQASATSTYTGFETGSTYANLIKSLVRAAALIRQDQRLGDAQLVAYGPSWIYNAIIEDTLTRRLNGADNVEFVKSEVDSVLAEVGVRYIGSDDIASLDDAGYADEFAPYTDAPVVILPAGSTKVLDGGERNLGITSDHNLDRQNTVASFDEFWEGLLVRNCNIKSLTIPVEECELTCPGA